MSKTPAAGAVVGGGPAPDSTPYVPRRYASPKNQARKPGILRRMMHAFLFSGPPVGAPSPHHKTYPWERVLWLTGVDYFSTLGYQPGIAFLAAGVLSPVATAILVAVTLVGALPTYREVARRSYIGQGSIAMLERLTTGWTQKILVLLLLGFATTDFVITITLSAADAAQHAIHNPLLHPLLGDHAMTVTLGLLALLAAVFVAGFREAIGMAVVVGIPYMVLNAVVILRALVEIPLHPSAWGEFSLALAAKGSLKDILLASALIFPKLALGLSGFETGVSVMPLIEGGDAKTPGADVGGRIVHTQKLLTRAALMMSVMLVTSSLATSVLIPAAEFQKGGRANGRALAYLAHELLGHGFGTVYDLVSICILWFAGASAMAGLMSLVPRYLPRFGMAPRWVAHHRPLVLLLFVVTVIVTWVFQADVDAQGGAYATGVLVLILSAAVAVALATWRETRTLPKTVGFARRMPVVSAFFWLVSVMFAFTLVDNVVERPDGAIISIIFCVLVVSLSGLSRLMRATELRVEKLAFVDEESAQVWETLRGKKVNLVPVRTPERETCLQKARQIRHYYKATGTFAFLHVAMRDDRSEFSTSLRVKVEREPSDGSLLISVTGAVAVANTIAYVSEQLDPIAIFLGLTLQNKMTQAVKYILWGEGEVGVLVHEILVRHWHSTPEDDVRPLIFLMSE